MKRLVTFNGREKGSHGNCEDIQVTIDADCDKDAFAQLYESYEHIVWATALGKPLDRDGVALDRDGLDTWRVAS